MHFTERLTHADSWDTPIYHPLSWIRCSRNNSPATEKFRNTYRHKKTPPLKPRSAAFVFYVPFVVPCFRAWAFSCFLVPLAVPAASRAGFLWPDSSYVGCGFASL